MPTRATKPENKRPSQASPNRPEALNALKSDLLEKGILKLKDFKSLSIPAEAQVEYLEELLTMGPFELIKGGIRVSLFEQIRRAFENAALLHLPSLSRTLKGASAQEVKTAALGMIKAGEARRVLRGKAEWLGTFYGAYLKEDELKELKALGLQAAKALRSKPAYTLLRDDIPDFHSNLFVIQEQFSAKPTALSTQNLTCEIRLRIRPDSDLCFVPDLVMALLPEHSLNTIHAALRQAAQERRIELRMESGLYRNSRLEMALCPSGLQDTRLAWIRLLEGVS